MKKESVIIGVLVILLIILAVIIFIFYNKNVELGRDNQDLINTNSNLLQEKDNLNNKIAEKDSELSMLQQDVEKIYKSCIAQNACKGHFPGIRWNCNNVGDETNINPSHVCVCDSSCNLNATEI